MGWKIIDACSSLIPKLLMLVATCAAAGPAIATGFTCTGQLEAREQAICNNSDLSRLDTVLNDDYRSLLAKLTTDAAYALRLEQRVWLRQVRQTCRPNPVFQSNLDPAHLEPTFVACLRDAYDARIKNLALSATGAQTHSDRSSQSPTAARDLADQIGRELPQILNDGQGIKLNNIAILNNLTLAVSRPNLPRPPSPALKIAIDKFALGSLSFEFTTSDVPGAALTLGGSANCSSWLAFDWHDAPATPTKLPEILRDGSCSGYGGSSGLATRNGQTFAIAAYDSGDKFMWLVQAWLGSGWSQPEARTATLSVQPSTQLIAKNCKVSQCGKLQDLALDLARHSNLYDPDAPGFPVISAADKARVDSLPTKTDAQSNFAQIYGDDNAQTTIVDFDGHKLVARAGPAVVAGWRTDGFIHIEISLLQPQRLAPVAEFVFAPERTPMTVRTIDNWHPHVN